MAANSGTSKSEGTSNRGFASMDDDKQREIASKGGQSVKPEDRSFAKDPELAAEAGRKGGENSHRGRSSGVQGGSGRGGNFADDPQKAAEAGRKGGRS